MISFQKIYGLYGLEHHTVEINGDVTMRTDERPNEQTNKQVKIELLSQWTVWDWVSQYSGDHDDDNDDDDDDDDNE